ncbi:hypothetical protein PSA7680_02032 [Pseudoruegeria aquimaris]|uniref:Sulfotransferase family protein n=1 Tax=Pseudoruegeria aquimaris TaxID=393663 RepID=A0A1Y5SHW5_9RHOB|nr:hypothetical protein [Pseudoruegeria aquimaris]SLN41077.1 hypothetical protein PSA7680_02032 [Pseudoruegeria aquimaris]
MGPGRAEFIKVCGERNCGTNWLEDFFLAQSAAELLHHRGFLMAHMAPEAFAQIERLPEAAQPFAREAMFDKLFRQHGRAFMGWKHQALRPRALQGDARAASCAFVIVVKHPAHFLASLFRNPYHDLLPARPSLEAFLGSPWLPVARDQLAPVILPSPLDLWARKMRSYLAFREAAPHAEILCYEALLADFEATMGAACEQLGIAVGALTPPEASAKAEKHSLKDYRARYLASSPWDSLPEALRAHVQAQVDPDLLAALGYPE